MKLAAMLFFCAAWAMISLGPMAAISSQSTIKIRVRGRRQIVATERGTAHALNVPPDQIDAAKLDDVSLLFVSRKQSFTYLLISACGLSKMPPDDRQCGSGIECNLLWLKIDERWKVVDSKSALYESCWLPITSDEDYKIKSRTLEMQYSDLRENKSYKLNYDADQPEKSFTITASPLKSDAQDD